MLYMLNNNGVTEKLGLHFKSWRGSDWALNWIIFFSVVYQKLVPIGFFVWLIFIYKDWKINSFIGFLKVLFSSPGTWFIAYYLMLLLGMLWTDNTPFGLSKLENKLSFLLLPIFILGTTLKTGLRDWKNTFLLALVGIVLFYELMAIIHSFDAPDTAPLMYFRESHFTLFMHRSYFACYLTVGLILLLEKCSEKWSFAYLMVMFILILATIQTFSKAGIIALGMVLFIYSFLKLYKRSMWLSLGVIFFLISSGVFVWKSDNLLSTRFLAMRQAFEETPLRDNPSVESNTSRILMWNASAEVIREHPLLGVGTGDYDDALAIQNEKLNNTGVYKERLNSHSQFLNTWVQIGFVGFAILSLFFIAPMTFSFNVYSLLMLITFFLHFLFESFLETQAGIILFCVFLMLLFTPKEHLAITTTNDQIDHE